MNPRVIIIGAGPVGLMTAIQIKLADPDVPILMLEKHQQYARKHLLYLHQDSFKHAHTDKDFQKMIRGFPDRIRTNELEDSLLAFAKKLKIEIQYAEVEDCKALAAKYPEAQVIVGADGSHSKVHEQIFDHQYQVQKSLRYVAEVKYEAIGETMPLRPLTEFVPTLSYANHFVSEYVGKKNKGTTPVALRIFIDKPTYEQMKAATFKDHYTFSDEAKIEASLYETIQKWLQARCDMANETVQPKSERITVTHLPVYASIKFVKEKYGKTFFLVGDAAFGVPYFRALNNGILCSSKLAIAIDAFLHKKPLIEDDCLVSKSITLPISPSEYYENFTQSLVKTEVRIAALKNFGVSAVESTAATSRFFPYAKQATLMTTAGGRQFKAHMKEEDGPSSTCTIL